jgi:hypothetical protein
MWINRLNFAGVHNESPLLILGATLQVPQVIILLRIESLLLDGKSQMPITM